MKSLFKPSFYTLLMLTISSTLQAAPCPFNAGANCTLQRDILNDIGPNGLKYYAPTNYDHRMSGEINVYDATLVTPSGQGAGQLKLGLNYIRPGFYKAGEILTRINLKQPPYNSPVASNPWTTKEIKHGYLEVVVKMPKCDTSDDGLCQAGKQPDNYQAGMWPAIWMMPTMDNNWPYNAEIDISEAYQIGRGFNVSTAALHFNGGSPRCIGGDCVGPGFPMNNSVSADQLFNNYHKWGFEWQPDPNSNRGGVLLSGYFDNVKVWGPMTSDSLPADGPNALSRGFNDPNGGYYLIVNFAIGGPYAGAPNAHLRTASMYIQSVKAYDVGGTGPTPTPNPPPPNTLCNALTNVKSAVSANKRQATLTWQAPASGTPVAYYQVNDWLNRVIWKGTQAGQRTFTDKTLPGTKGTFVYYLYTNCTDGTKSAAVRYDLRI